MNRKVSLTLALSLLAVGTLHAQGNIENDGQDYVGRILIISDSSPSSVTYCGITYFEYNCVIINPGRGPTMVTTVAIDPCVGASAGDRYDIENQTECDGRLQITLSKRPPRARLTGAGFRGFQDVNSLLPEPSLLAVQLASTYRPLALYTTLLLLRMICS